MKIVPMQPADWPAVRDIYLEGIATGNATFQKTAPEWEEWDELHMRAPRLVAWDGGEVLGWIAVSPVSKRAVYAGVAEVSVYIAERARGQGIGLALLKAGVEE